jgi:hypothetical protein
MSGVSAANSRRAFKHILRYALFAEILRGSCLPYILFAYAISLFAFLHCSVNQGASVFPHLLGFLGVVGVISRTTPALTASYNMNASTAAALSVLLLVESDTRAENLLVKSSVAVYSVHFYAEVA